MVSILDSKKSEKHRIKQLCFFALARVRKLVTMYRNGNSHALLKEVKTSGAILSDDNA